MDVMVELSCMKPDTLGFDHRSSNTETMWRSEENTSVSFNSAEAAPLGLDMKSVNIDI